jgi:hypothetical protein
MVNKDWKILVFTPFGTEGYTMVINQTIPFVSGRLFSHKGEMIFENGTLINNEIEIESRMDYPISCVVKIKAKVQEEKMSGRIYIDEYLSVPFKGEI